MPQLRRSRISGAGAALLAGICALPCAAMDIGLTVSLASDYMRRGASQNLGDPVLQGGVFVATDVGLHGAVWASNVDFIAPDRRFDDGAGIEIDYLPGYGNRLGEEWSHDLSVGVHRYPCARTTASCAFASPERTAKPERIGRIVALSEGVFRRAFSLPGGTATLSL